MRYVRRAFGILFEFIFLFFFGQPLAFNITMEARITILLSTQVCVRVCFPNEFRELQQLPSGVPVYPTCV